MVTLTAPKPAEVKKYGGIPEMPASYWEYWKDEMPLFKMGTPRRPKTWIVAFNGARGGGKSGSAAYVTATERLLRGIPVYTIPASYYIRVPIIWEGKEYVFYSEPLNIDDLFAFKEYLRGSAIMADEANIQLADSHRSMSNRNLAISDYGQQARHLDTSFFYTVISPTWIDPRLRQLTDVLVYCSDCANSNSGEEAGLEEGEYCNWNVTDNSGQLTGVPYEIDPVGYPWSLRLKEFWSIYESKNLSDTQEARRNVEYKNNKITVQIGEDPNAEAYRGFMNTVEQVVNQYASAHKDEGEILLKASELAKTLGIADDDVRKRQVYKYVREGLSIESTKKANGTYFDLTPLVSRV